MLSITPSRCQSISFMPPIHLSIVLSSRNARFSLVRPFLDIDTTSTFLGSNRFRNNFFINWRKKRELNSHRVLHRPCLADKSDKPIFSFLPLYCLAEASKCILTSSRLGGGSRLITSILSFNHFGASTI